MQHSVPYINVGKVLIGNAITAPPYKILKLTNNDLPLGEIYHQKKKKKKKEFKHYTSDKATSLDKITIKQDDSKSLQVF